VEYDEEQVSYADLLGVFFGETHARKAKVQYRSTIFAADDDQYAQAVAALREHSTGDAVEVLRLGAWHDAEDYHQRYYANNPGFACRR